MRNYIMRIENASHLISVLTHFFPPTVAYCCVLYASLVLITHNIPGFPGFTYIGQLIIPSLSRELPSGLPHNLLSNSAAHISRPAQW